MKTEVKLITPQIAEEMLKKNTMNRALRPKKLYEYIREMSMGLWKEETGEAIKIATDNSIIDGQHRLHAIIKSGNHFRNGTTIKFLKWDTVQEKFPVAI